MLRSVYDAPHSRRALSVTRMRFVPCTFALLLTLAAPAVSAQMVSVDAPGPPMALVPAHAPPMTAGAPSRSLELLIPPPAAAAPLSAPVEQTAAAPLIQSASADQAR